MSQIGRRLAKLEATQNINANPAPTLDEMRDACEIIGRATHLKLVLETKEKFPGYWRDWHHSYELTDDDREFLSKTAEIEQAQEVDRRYREAHGIKVPTMTKEEADKFWQEVEDEFERRSTEYTPIA